MHPPRRRPLLLPLLALIGLAALGTCPRLQAQTAAHAAPATTVTAAAPATPALRQAQLPTNSQHVLFLGDSITYSGQYVAFIETYFRLRWRATKVEFLDLGLSSETVSGLSEPDHAGGKFPRPVLSERLARVLAQVRPDCVFVCYGMNDGIYLPLDETRFAAYREGILWLERSLRRLGAHTVWLTPPPYDGRKTAGPAYTATLAHYASWLLTHGRDSGWRVIDLHGPLTRYEETRCRTEPDFALAKDGIHPGDLGHWLMARAVLTGLGAADLENILTPEALYATHPRGAEVYKLIRERQQLMRDAWLTVTGHQRPGVRVGKPLPKAEAEACALDTRIAALLAPW